MGEAEVLGMKLDTFGWTKAVDAADTEMPWEACAKLQSRICGEIVQLKLPNSCVAALSQVKKGYCFLVER